MKLVRFLTCGTTSAPAAVVGTGVRGSEPLPTVVAVCERADGSIWLIDAGWSAETCSEPARWIGRLRTTLLSLRIAPGDDVASQLRRAGLDPGKVTRIIATHLHLDHVGGAQDFPNAELIATREEFEAARERGELGGYRAADLSRAGRLRPIELERAPFQGFPRSLTLDDDVVIADASGHTLGHVAVFVREGDTQWVHAGDVAYVSQEIRRCRTSALSRLLAQDHSRLRATRDRIRALPADVRLVLSHDRALFDALPHL